MTMDKFNNEKRVAEVIQENTPVSGVYILPSFKHNVAMNKEEMKDNMMMGKEMMKTGPVVFAVVQKNGMKMGGAAAMIFTLIVQIVLAYLITWLFTMTKAMSYRRQVAFITMVALVAAIMIYVPDMIWGGTTLGFTVVAMLDVIIGWFFGGLVIAKLCKK